MKYRENKFLIFLKIIGIIYQTTYTDAKSETENIFKSRL